MPYEAETHAEEDFVYDTIDGLTARLTGYVGTASVVDIHGTCTGIGDHAFRNCPSLAQIRIPEGCARVYVCGARRQEFARCTSNTNNMKKTATARPCRKAGRLCPLGKA